MMWLVMMWLGCSNPIDSCPTTDIDCCDLDRECQEVYGDDYPFCTTPGESSGVCSECVIDADCSGDLLCTDDGSGLRLCE